MNDSDLARGLGRVEGKIDQMLDLIKERGTRLDGMDARLHSVEKKVWYASGVGAVLGVIGAKLGLPIPGAA